MIQIRPLIVSPARVIRIQHGQLSVNHKQSDNLTCGYHTARVIEIRPLILSPARVIRIRPNKILPRLPSFFATLIFKFFATPTSTCFCYPEFQVCLLPSKCVCYLSSCCYYPDFQVVLLPRLSSLLATLTFKLFFYPIFQKKLLPRLSRCFATLTFKFVCYLPNVFAIFQVFVATLTFKFFCYPDFQVLLLP